jgi:hypothetical protein
VGGRLRSRLRFCCKAEWSLSFMPASLVETSGWRNMSCGLLELATFYRQVPVDSSWYAVHILNSVDICSTFRVLGKTYRRCPRIR